MADARISIGINADVGNALTGLQQVSTAATATGTALGNIAPVAVKAGSDLSKAFAGVDFSRVSNSFANLKNQVAGFGGGVSSFTSTFRGIEAASVVAIRSIDQLEAEISQLQTELNRSVDVTQIKRLGAEIERLTTQANNLKVVGLEKSLDRASSSAARATGRFGGLSRTSNQASQALINVGRVAQDLPFGIIGIANNLNPLLESFQRVRAESKSFGGAMKALGASLLGGGGLGLALSLVTGALSYFALRSRSAKSDTEELAKSTNVAADREKEFKDAVDKASASVVAQADTLKDLKEILISTSDEIRSLTVSTINQGLAQFIFDKKNVEVQKLLSAEIQKQLALRKQNDIRANVPAFDPGEFSKNPLDRQIADANQQLGLLNAQGTGLESFFKIFVEGKKKVKDGSDEVVKFAKKLQETLQFEAKIIFGEFDSDKELLDKAKKTIDAFNKGDFKLKLQVVTETFSEPPKPEDLFPSDLSSLFNRNGAILGQQFVDGFTEAAESATGTGLLTAFEADILFKEFEKEFAKFGKNLPKIDIGKSLFANREDLSKQLKQVAASFELAKLAANTASQAFGSAFDALFEGENVADAVANSFKALIKDIARAIIQTLIFKAVSGLFGFGGLPGSGAAGLGGIGGQIAGLGGLSTPSGQTARLSPGLIPVQVSGQFVQRGNVMVATISQTQISQGRNG